jgi:hypothetical protein
MYKFSAYFPNSGMTMQVERAKRNIHYLPDNVAFFPNKRDSERGKSYDAENKVLGSFFNLRDDEKLTVQQSDALIDYVSNSIFFLTRFAQKERGIRVNYRRAVGSSGDYHEGEIRLNSDALSIKLILHELAHTITSPFFDAGHGHYWRTNYLSLLWLFGSKFDSMALAREYNKTGLSFDKFIKGL